MTPIKRRKGRLGAGIAPHRRGKRPLLNEEGHRISNEVAASLSAVRRTDSGRSGFVADILAYAGGPIQCDPSADWSTVHASLPDDAGVVAGCTRA